MTACLNDNAHCVGEALCIAIVTPLTEASKCLPASAAGAGGAGGADAGSAVGGGVGGG
jgi:hypothetical protein